MSVAVPGPTPPAPAQGQGGATAVLAAAQETALADYIRQRAGAHLVEWRGCLRLSGGTIQDNLAVTLRLAGGAFEGVRTFVVRRDAPSRITASLSRIQEFQVLSVAARQGVAVPEPYWLCEDAALIGSAFFVMEHLPGSTSPVRLLGTALGDARARVLVRRLGCELATLHQIHPPVAQLDFLPAPAGNPAHWRIRVYRAALDRIPEPHPVLEWALAWLEAQAPSRTQWCLCHGDFRTGNYLVDDGRLTGVLDWEFATWSDPYEDLGWLCCRSWRFGVPQREVGGVGDKADLFDSYGEQTGQPVDARLVQYWEVMAMVRWAVIALQQARRHLCGEEHSLQLALTGRMVPEIEYDILQQVDAIEGEHRVSPS